MKQLSNSQAMCLKFHEKSVFVINYLFVVLNFMFMFRELPPFARQTSEFQLNQNISYHHLQVQCTFYIFDISIKIQL